MARTRLQKIEPSNSPILPCEQSDYNELGHKTKIQFSRAEFGYLLESTIVLDHPLEEVFPFFANAVNLERITPPFLNFRIVTPLPIQMYKGREIEYKLRLHGIPINWVSRITAWEPLRLFVDEQIKGPYRLWRHEHLFESLGHNKTLVVDKVRYALWGGEIINQLFIKDDLHTIFNYRAKQLKAIFPSPNPEVNRLRIIR
jgi:ligand-binding SRPBCC domain-containing protein